jgi:hypothetical protein
MTTINICLYTYQEIATFPTELFTNYNSNFVRKQTIKKDNNFDNQTVQLSVVPPCFEKTSAQSPSKLVHMVNTSGLYSESVRFESWPGR